MSELKTLKDLTIGTGELDKTCDPYELRQEAINWINYWESQRKKINRKTPPRELDGRKLDKDSTLFYESRMYAFKEFFNISEEDLK